MDYVVQYVGDAGRERYLLVMKQQLPDLRIFEDVERRYIDELGMKSSMKAFLDSINRESAFVRLEDDAILCRDFRRRVDERVAEHPDCLHQFFSMRESDYAAGSRFVAGYKFMCAVCLYFPVGMGSDIVDYYYREWRNSKSGVENPTGFDTMIRDYLKEKHLKYFVDIPCLVQHADGKSAINPRRSSKRQTRMFIDEVI